MTCNVNTLEYACKNIHDLVIISIFSYVGSLIVQVYDTRYANSSYPITYITKTLNFRVSHSRMKG